VIKFNKLIMFLIGVLVASCIIVINGCNNIKLNSDGVKGVAMVFPVTIDSFEQFRTQAQKVFSDNSIELSWFSAEGDPSKFNSSIQAALLKKPKILVSVGTQVTNTAFGPQFDSNLPILVASAISAPEKVESLVKVGLEPPRSRKVAIISDSPKEDIYVNGAQIINSFIKGDKQVGIIYNTSEINSKNTAFSLAKEVEKLGMKVIPGIINNQNDVEQVAKSLLIKGADILVIPHDKFAVTKAKTIVKLGLENNPKVPTFSLDDGTVKDGVAVGISVNYGLLGKTTAEQCLLILSGKDPSSMPIYLQDRANIYINKASLDILKISLPEKYLKDAIVN
jgi:putative tryptophan/tyrosine transport system substrate-binding protein